MKEAQFDRLEKIIVLHDERMNRLDETMLAIKASLDEINLRLGVIEELAADLPTMNKRLTRLDKRLKSVEVGLKVTQVAVHDLSLETRKHNKQIEFLTRENLQCSRQLSTLFKQEEHHDNRIAILFERMAVG